MRASKRVLTPWVVPLAFLVLGAILGPNLAPQVTAAQVPMPTRIGAESPCQPLVQEQLRAWAVVEPARPQPGTSAAGVVRHWPTSQLGVWVVESIGIEASQVTRVDPRSVTRVEWGARCDVSTTSRDRSAQPPPRFSDADLAALLAKSPRGVLYVWSPHMPLSVDAYAALVQAANARALEVTALLDPAADREFARASIDRSALQAAALRVADSVELTFRDVLVHAPSIQVYEGGRLQGSPFPGAHTSFEYGTFLDRVLSSNR